MPTIVLKRGTLAGLPSGGAGEPLFTTDQFRLYVGSSGGNRLLGLLDKINGTTAPGVNDDAGAGYSVGSHWTDTTNAKAYTCVDSTTGAAVWQQFSGTGAGSGISQLTGDVTAGPGSGSQAATIPNDTVTYAKMQNISATKRLLGRNTPAAGDPEEISIAQLFGWLGSTVGDVLYYSSATGWTVRAIGAANSIFYVKNTAGTLEPDWQPISSFPSFVAAGGSHAKGVVPDPGATAHTNTPYFLGDDASFHIHAGVLKGGNFTATSETTASGTAADLTTVQSIAVTVDVAGEVYCVCVSGTTANNTAAAVNRLYVDDGTTATIVAQTACTTANANYNLACVYFTITFASTGAKTIKIKFSTNAGTATFSNRGVKVERDVT